MERYHLGVDWADKFHQIWVSDGQGQKITEKKVQVRRWRSWRSLAAGLMKAGAKGSELWAAIEKPQGRIVDFLLDHGVVVYPVNPKARGSGPGSISHELSRRAILLMPMYWQNFSGPIMGICAPLEPSSATTPRSSRCSAAMSIG